MFSILKLVLGAIFVYTFVIIGFLTDPGLMMFTVMFLPVGLFYPLYNLNPNLGTFVLGYPVFLGIVIYFILANNRKHTIIAFACLILLCLVSLYGLSTINLWGWDD